ncbi:hypothetical protein [Hydrogenimonas sp. SS33]|uniref:hypothetical protein n=1 Tax=Hydrogenimonas leucolamina TaxID=2954236 RepID=UPI00336BD26D
MKYIPRIPLPTFAFLMLFSAEFTYYLLILQTGIVEYHHSLLSEVWMVPAGGMIGILLSIGAYPRRRWLMPSLLFVQLLLSFSYASANGWELFLLGLISGLTAPMLIALVPRLWVVAVALAFSYLFGTWVFDVPAIDRTSIAVSLSAVALGASFLGDMRPAKCGSGTVSLYSMGNIFLWLLLDAALFETLSRDAVMHLWGEEGFAFPIILFHLIGLAAAYGMRSYRHNDALLLGLFAFAYATYASGSQAWLCVVYPFVISYYNVVIMEKLIRLPYTKVAMASLSLWAASGLGLLIALSHTFAIAWTVLGLLFVNYMAQSTGFRALFSLGKGFPLIPDKRSAL